MQKVVEQMNPAETERFSPWRFFTERKVGGKIEIGDEAEGIAKGVGYIDIDELLQQKIESILQGGCKHANKDQTKKFSESTY